MKSYDFFNIAFLVLAAIFMVASTMAALIQPVKAVTNSLTNSKRLLAPQDYLSVSYYQTTCPRAEAIIQQKVQAWFQKDYTLAASIIRLHFHDCAVRGCDASILLNHPGSERRAKVSATLRGFQVMDEIKADVERACPRTVSCADILTAAARDATVLLGGPFWEVPFGRKDGKISTAKEADTVPQGHENVTALIKFFEEKGLNVLDLVALSGAHTIGRTSCYSILHRLANFNGSGKRDPSLDVKYLKNLIKECKWSTNFVNLDKITPKTFDNTYYTNLGNKLGTLSTDQALFADPNTAPFVEAMATQQDLFMNQFLVSMVKLGNVQVLTQPNEGEIRLNCNFVNKN